MKRFFLIGVLVTLVSSPGSATLYGCGDKLLSMGKGVRLQSTAAFLLYRSRTSKERLAVNDPSLTGLLKHDGHSLRFAENIEELTYALKKFKIDAVLVDQAEETEVRGMVDSASSKPRLYVLPSARAPRTRYMALVQTVVVSKRK